MNTMFPHRAARGAAGIGALVLAAVIPKCPVCVAAALSALGLGTALSGSIAPFARPGGFALCALVLFAAGFAWRKRRRRAIAASLPPLRASTRSTLSHRAPLPRGCRSHGACCLRGSS
jgi:hypothetical protein